MFPLVPQVFPVGSVPLKTYLPDGDIDLAAFSDNQHSNDNLVNEVRNILESEENSEAAEYRVKEVQYIEAEVCASHQLDSQFSSCIFMFDNNVHKSLVVILN